MLRFADIRSDTGSASYQLLGKDIFMFYILHMLTELHNPYRKSERLFRYHPCTQTFNFQLSIFNSQLPSRLFYHSCAAVSRRRGRAVHNSFKNRLTSRPVDSTINGGLVQLAPHFGAVRRSVAFSVAANLRHLPTILRFFAADRCQFMAISQAACRLRGTQFLQKEVYSKEIWNGIFGRSSSSPLH